MAQDRDIPEGSNELTLVERMTPQAFREWQIAGIGGLDHLRPEIRSQILTPEEELRDLLALMLPNDELWFCRSNPFQPMYLIGNEGLAIVRDGKPIIYRAVRHY